MSAMALGSEAFQTDSACDLSMRDRKRSFSRRLSCRRVRISLEKGWLRLQGMPRDKTEGGRVTEKRFIVGQKRGS